MIRLSKEQVKLLHTQLIRETGGLDGVRDEGLLDSALNAPFQGFDGVDTFPSVQQKAARLGFGLAQNHAFIDGNKRIGAHPLSGGVANRLPYLADSRTFRRKFVISGNSTIRNRIFHWERFFV